MVAGLHRLWDDLWPNIIAPSAWTILAVIVADARRAVQAERHHREHMATLREGEAGAVAAARPGR